MEIKEGLISSAITVTNKTSLYGLPSGNFYDPTFLLGGMHCFTCSFLLFPVPAVCHSSCLLQRGTESRSNLQDCNRNFPISFFFPIRFDNRFGSVGRAQTIAR